MRRCSEDGQVDLGLKLLNQGRSFQLNQRSSDDNDDGDGGPTSCYSTTSMSDTHNVASTNVAGIGVGVSYPSTHHHLFKNLGGMGTTELGFPFTATQWKELERQAMIYKYMVSSLPVPPHLLYSSFPTTLSSSYLMGRYGNGMSYKWVGNSKDAEPGRCRRTDGKKWRCSRDVAPNQKYCERHLNRGRPRSRKPVELLHNNNNNNTSNPQRHDLPINKNTTIKKTRFNDPDLPSLGSSFPCISPRKISIFDHPLVSGANHFDHSRSMISNEEQQWQQLVETNMNAQVFQHQIEGESLNLTSQIDYNAKTDIGLLERPLFDSWPTVTTGSKDNCESNKVFFSSSNDDHENMCQIHMGLRVNDPWVETSASPGGPLAEVLRPGSFTTTAHRSPSDPVTSDAGEGLFVTPPATAVSSPSGVLPKTFTSFSDSSSSSSPTCPSSKAKPDMPFHWLS